MDSTIVYVPPYAIANHYKDLTGSNLKDCHNEKSNEKIDKVIAWFRENHDNNSGYTCHNDEESKDV